MKLVPKGISDYQKIIDQDKYYIDKTLLIKDVLEIGEAILYTRPRRFGKTLNMSMLQCFFEKTEEDKTSYFEDKKIWKEEECQKHFGKYPVIFLTFKDCKEKNIKNMIDIIKEVISQEYQRHYHIIKKMNTNDKQVFERILKKEDNNISFSFSILILSKLLKKHYQEKVLILLDEYDTPVIQSFLDGFYDDFMPFYATLLSTALKDNPCLFKGVLTGITRVAKESIFSGLNNFTSDSMIFAFSFDKFGITEGELKEALTYYEMEEHFQNAEKWYNGYQINGVKLYNPFSIIDFIKERGRIDLYWLHTSSNEFIIKLIQDNFEKSKEKLILLGEGKCVETTITDNVIFKNLKNNESSLMSILFYSGYLKAHEVLDPLSGKALVSIPNQEILMCYKNIFGSLFTYDPQLVPHILEALLKEDYQSFHQELDDALLKTASIFDITQKENENFYHALFLGLILSLKKEDYLIQSNKESGLGRADLMIIPQKKERTGFVLEFKKEKNPQNLPWAAQEGLLQIQEKKYDTLFEGYGILNVHFLSIAFCGKQFYLKTNKEEINESLIEKNKISNPPQKSLPTSSQNLKITKEEKIALNFLLQGVPLEVVSSSTGISLERLQVLLRTKF